MQNAAYHDVGEELDRLCELANVGAGHAATAFGDNATAIEQYRSLP